MFMHLVGHFIGSHSIQFPFVIDCSTILVPSNRLYLATAQWVTYFGDSSSPIQISLKMNLRAMG